MVILRYFVITFGMILAIHVQARESKIVNDVAGSAEWIAVALNSYGYRADFSLESLKEVDRLFVEQVPNGKPKRGSLLSVDAGRRLFALGSYVGEVIRRNAGGTWSGDDADPEAEMHIALRLKNGTTLWPVQRVMKRFKNARAEGIYRYASAVARPDSTH